LRAKLVHDRKENPMKILRAAAVAVLLASGMAYAQDNTTTGATGSGPAGDRDPNYLTGPTTRTLFTDETRTTVRPPAEFKAAWEELNDADREDILRACSANRDVTYNPLCTNAKAM
jgi:hypothetical protein